MPTTDQIDLARRVAAICGPHSGAARAVARYDALRDLALDVSVSRTDGMWFVGNEGAGVPDYEFTMAGRVQQ